MDCVLNCESRTWEITWWRSVLIIHNSNVGWSLASDVGHAMCTQWMNIDIMSLTSQPWYYQPTRLTRLRRRDELMDNGSPCIAFDHDGTLCMLTWDSDQWRGWHSNSRRQPGSRMEQIKTLTLYTDTERSCVNDGHDHIMDQNAMYHVPATVALCAPGQAEPNQAWEDECDN